MVPSLTPGEWDMQVKNKKITAIKVTANAVKLCLESGDVLRIQATPDYHDKWMAKDFQLFDVVLDNKTEEWTFS